MQEHGFKYLKLTEPLPNVLCVALHRPKKLNAIHREMFEEIGKCFASVDPRFRCVVLQGDGRMFTAGLDLNEAPLGENGAADPEDPARVGFYNQRGVRDLQSYLSAIEACSMPVIAAIHGGCIGAGVDIICCACIRLASADAYFRIQEVNVGLCADIGTLQRLPRLGVNHSKMFEWAYTGRKFTAAEAHSSGLLSDVYPNKEDLQKAALKLAGDIAEKSPVAVVGTKANLLFSREHQVEESLRFQALWASLYLQTSDVRNAIMAVLQKKKPTFSRL
eukprot:g3030.t1